MNGEFVAFGITVIACTTLALVFFYAVCEAGSYEKVRDFFSACLVGGLFLVWAFPVLYVAAQGWYWLENGEFRSVNLCSDVNWFCSESEPMKGLSKVLQLLSSSPFFTLTMVSLGSQACLQWLLNDIDRQREFDRRLRDDDPYVDDDWDDRR